LTDEQQGGSAPEREAIASAQGPATEDAVAAIAVAEEPEAVTSAPEGTTPDPEPTED